MKNEDSCHLLGISETQKSPKNVISFVTQLELEQRTLIIKSSLKSWEHYREQSSHASFVQIFRKCTGSKR